MFDIDVFFIQSNVPEEWKETYRMHRANGQDASVILVLFLEQATLMLSTQKERSRE